MSLKIYDVLGREVATLVSGVRTPGRHRVEFDASRLAGGVYLYRLVSGGHVIVKKMLVMK